MNTPVAHGTASNSSTNRSELSARTATALGDRRIIAVEVDSHAVYHGAYREPITDAGTAHLDRLTWVTRRHLTELVAQLHPDRHAPVTSIIRELIGNI